MDIVSAGFFEWFMSPDGEALQEDVRVWRSWNRNPEGESLEDSLLELFISSNVFRRIFDYRAWSSENGRRFGNMSREEFPRFNGISIECPRIGPRFIIQHGTGTYIYAKEIGSDFWINQNVTIGSNGRGIPTIGNHVTVSTGAVVVGNITIGDRVHITANAVVNFDVPSNSKVYAPRAITRPMR